MTITEAHIAFKLELDKSSSLDTPAYEPEEIDFWLNNGVRKFVKTRYSGTNIKREAFEQSQKRIDDLRTIVVYETLPCSSNHLIRTNSYLVDLTDLTYDYWFTLSEEVKIAYISLIDSTTVITSGNLVSGGVYKVVSGTVTHAGIAYTMGSYFIATATTYTGGSVITASSSVEPVKESNANTYTMQLQNPYSEHILHYEKASPLRLFLGDSVELITDGQYQPLLYNIRYLRKPIQVSLTSNVSFDLPEHTHDEIVRLAVNMALENIEQPRYQSHMNEVVTME